MPIYGLAFNLAQLIVLAYGIYLIAAGQLTVGLLIGFLLYVNSFYMPLRQLAAVWSSFQLALAGLDRISAVLALESNMPIVPPAEPARPGAGPRVRARRTSAIRADRRCCGTHVRARAGQDLRAGRSDRRRQDDHGVADGAALRSDRRTRAARRPGHPLVPAGGTRAERSASSFRSRSCSPARSATTSSTATSRTRRTADEQIVGLLTATESRRPAGAIRAGARDARSRRRRRRSASGRSSSSRSCAPCCGIRRS